MKSEKFPGKAAISRKPTQEINLILSTESSQEIQDFNGDEEALLAHLESSESPSWRSHSSALTQRAGELSSILAARTAE